MSELSDLSTKKFLMTSSGEDPFLPFDKIFFESEVRRIEQSVPMPISKSELLETWFHQAMIPFFSDIKARYHSLREELDRTKMEREEAEAEALLHARDVDGHKKRLELAKKAVNELNSVLHGG